MPSGSDFVCQIVRSIERSLPAQYSRIVPLTESLQISLAFCSLPSPSNLLSLSRSSSFEFLTQHLLSMTDDSAEATRQRAQALEAVVSDVVEGRLALSDFAKHLQDAGASPAEGEDYLQQLTQRLEQQKKNREADEQPDAQSGEQAFRESTPEGLDEVQAVDFRVRHDALLEEVRIREAADCQTAVDTAAWAVLNAKLSCLASSQVSNNAMTLLSAEDLAKLLGVERSAPQSLPASVLALAPHLAELSTSAISDPHIEETWKLRQAIGTDKTIDSLVNLMQVQPLADPIPRSIWRSVIQDHFVDFEKLFASMDKGYDHNDEPRDFGGGYALIKKEQASAKRSLRSESEWLRVFGAWSSAVVLVYRHQSQSFKATSAWSLTCFVQYLMTHQLLSLLMLKLATTM